MNRRFALIQALVSLVALAAVVLWAGKQESPHIPTGADTIAWLIAAVGLYVVATLVRAERWHQILDHTGVTRSGPTATRSRPWATWATTSFLPARARRCG